jgi:RNA polymerase sigma-70 factor (ECF subfamily)
MIARRRLIDRWRQRGRRLNGDAVDVNDVPIADDRDDGRRVELTEEAARVTEAMEQLGAKQKKVLNLAVCEGWSHQQIADQLNLPLGTVKTNIRRGLMRVRELLGVDTAAAGKETLS